MEASTPDRREGLSSRRIATVRKRDGRTEAFDEAKLASAIHRAACAVGQDNRYLANDLAGAVTTYLERYHDRALPESAEIQTMVERILFETGHADIARAFMLHRSEAPAPAAPPAPAGDLFPAEPLLVDAATRDEVSAWGRERISAALVKEAGVDDAVARDIATVVEARIFATGQRRVSTSMIRELVNQELLVRGHHVKLRKQLVVGLPKYDLDRMVRVDEASRAVDPESLCRTIGETTMRQYALQEVYPRDVADAHLEGRIHIHHIEYPLKTWWVAPSVENVRRTGIRGPLLGEAPRTARALGQHLEALVRDLAPRTAQSIELAHLNAHLAMLPGDPAEESADLVARLVGRPVSIAVDLGLPAYLRAQAGEAERRSDLFAMELLRAARETGRDVTCFVGESSFGEPLREACRGAARHGRTRFVFERGAAPPARLSRWMTGDQPLIAAQAVTLNLPQAVLRSGERGDFYAELETAIAAAVQAHLQKRTMTKTPGRADMEHFIGIAGLAEAAELLSGKSAAEDDGALRLALRILSYLYFRVREEAGRHAMRLSLQDAADAEVCGRFVRIDRELFARARGRQGGYTPGGRLGADRRLKPAELVELEARFHTLVPGGAATLLAAERQALSPGDIADLVERTFRSSPAAQVLVE